MFIKYLEKCLAHSKQIGIHFLLQLDIIKNKQHPFTPFE